MNAFFSVAAVLALLLGILWLFFPEMMLASLRGQAAATAVYMARRYGVLFFG